MSMKPSLDVCIVAVLHANMLLHPYELHKSGQVYQLASLLKAVL